MRSAPRLHGARAGLGLAAFALLALPPLAGCNRQRRATSPEPLPDVEVVHESATVEVPMGEGAAPVSVRAEWTFPEGVESAPVVLFAPGGGSVSRRGTRTSDGSVAYPRPVDVTRALAREVAERGMIALAWDKRTCGPTDTPLCDRYPTSDLDDEGPRALVKDLDAACRLALEDERSDGRVVLWAHGQGAQVALTSNCAKDASAVVLVAPIPRRVDKVMVASLWARAQAAQKAAQRSGDEEAAELALQLKNRTASREAMFEAIEEGQFPEDARILGATLAFWKAWIDLTDQVPGGAPDPASPWIVVLGARDTQYGPTDHERIRALGEAEGAVFLEVEGADHHLLREGALAEEAIAPILEALDAALAGRPLARATPGCDESSLPSCRGPAGA